MPVPLPAIDLQVLSQEGLLCGQIMKQRTEEAHIKVCYC